MLPAGARVTGLAPQLRTTDLEGSIRFYVERLGFTLGFRWEDYYAGICAGDAEFHLKRVDTPDPTIAAVAAGDHLHLYVRVDGLDALVAAWQARGVAILAGPIDRPWGMREVILRDDQGHTLYVGEALPAPEPEEGKA